MATLSAQNLSSLPQAATAFYARYGRYLPTIVTLFLVIVIAKLLAQLVWAVIPTPASAAWTPIQPPPVTVSTNNTVDLGSIASASLFGTYAPPAVPSALDAAAAAPDTQLALTLLGILNNGRRPESSRALIGTQGGEEQPYAVGDDITRGVTLQAIFPDRVILSRGGQLETLRLDKDAVGTGGLLPAPIQPQQQDPDGAAGASLSAIRAQMLADPSKVADYIRVQPVNNGNGINGYRIYPGKDRSVFTAAGLRPGDIVTAVNGVQLNDPGKSLQLLSDLSQNSQLNLTVDRGGQPQNFNINIGQ